MTAIVLAGGPHDEIAASTPGAPNKAFAQVAGISLVERTLRALRSSPSIGHIIAVAPLSVHGSSALRFADECRPDGQTASASLESGLRGLPGDPQTLVSASDLPILSVAGIEDYVARARASDADVTYGCIERRVHMARYPTVPHTWAPLKDGTYCGSGFITLRPRIYPALAGFIERLGRARKNPLRLASLFGWSVLIRFATRRLSIAQAEARASSVLGERVRGIVSPYPEIGVNVDRVSDLKLAAQLIAASANA